MSLFSCKSDSHRFCPAPPKRQGWYRLERVLVNIVALGKALFCFLARLAFLSGIFFFFSSSSGDAKKFWQVKKSNQEAEDKGYLSFRSNSYSCKSSKRESTNSSKTSQGSQFSCHVNEDEKHPKSSAYWFLRLLPDNILKILKSLFFPTSLNCNGLNVYVPQIHMLKSYVIVLGGEAFGRGSGHEGRDSGMRSVHV